MNSLRMTRRALLRQTVLLGSGGLLAACAAPAAPAPPTGAPAIPPAPPTMLPATVAPTSPPPTDMPAPAPTDTQPPPAPTVAPSATLAPAVAALPATPACFDNDEPTPAQTEGPYYTPNTPARTSFIEEGMGGTRIRLSGQVLDTRCQPVAQALIDLWHCDDQGVYDNTGYRLRGHFFSDENGAWQVDTIVPGLYPGRTRHFHVRVQPPNQPILTTQLYFPGEPGNARDGIYREECQLEISDGADGKLGRFNFVLDVG